MDKRKTEVQLMAEHREVEMLKQRFVLNHSANKFSASKNDSGRKKG
jgi:hypothetical protein